MVALYNFFFVTGTEKISNTWWIRNIKYKYYHAPLKEYNTLFLNLKPTNQESIVYCPFYIQPGKQGKHLIHSTISSVATLQ